MKTGEKMSAYIGIGLPELPWKFSWLDLPDHGLVESARGRSNNVERNILLLQISALL
jgi:hypothetical protein